MRLDEVVFSIWRGEVKHLLTIRTYGDNVLAVSRFSPGSAFVTLPLWD